MEKIELLKLQTNADENQNSTQSNGSDELEYQEIENTPFTIIRKEKKQWVLVMGDELITQKVFENKQEAEEYVDSKPWELIVVASTIFMNKSKRVTEQIKEENK